MITYIEILHLCSFSVVATEPSAEQPWLRTDRTAALSLYQQVQISRPQPASNVSSEYQRYPGSEPQQWCHPLENTYNSPEGQRSHPRARLNVGIQRSGWVICGEARSDIWIKCTV